MVAITSRIGTDTLRYATPIITNVVLIHILVSKSRNHAAVQKLRATILAIGVGFITIFGTVCCHGIFLFGFSGMVIFVHSAIGFVANGANCQILTGSGTAGMAACTSCNFNHNGFNFIVALICAIINGGCSCCTNRKCLCGIFCFPYPASWQGYGTNGFRFISHIHGFRRHVRRQSRLVYHQRHRNTGYLLIYRIIWHKHCSIFCEGSYLWCYIIRIFRFPDKTARYLGTIKDCCT